MWLPLLLALPARALYPTSAPLRTGTLGVSPLHTLYFEEHGRADGAPALFLHGGPGSGSFARHAGFFDPQHYRVVLYDQRGCGRSTPTGCLDENDTASLVADIERLRLHLQVVRWEVVVGGSWGVTLALAYAVAHPRSVGALVLRAVCLMRSHETRWLFGEEGGAARLQPDGWEAFARHAEESGASGGGGERALRQYVRLLAAADGSTRAAAARAWTAWEMRIFGLGRRLPPLPLPPAAAGGAADGDVWEWEPRAAVWRCGAIVLQDEEVREALVNQFEPRLAAALGVPPSRLAAAGAVLGDAAAGAAMGLRSGVAAAKTALASAAGSAAASPRSPAPPAGEAAAGDSAWIPAQNLLTAYYSLHHAFIGGDHVLLDAVASTLRSTACIAVHGGNDVICPPATAYELHQVWPEMQLRIVPGAGHSMYDPGLQTEVLRAVDSFRAGSLTDH